MVDNAALREVLLAREDLQAVLDVWEGEPEVDVDLADLCVLATPHIAGYSLDGKQRGTAQIYQALCAHLGQEPSIHLSDLLPAPWLAEMHLATLTTDPAWALATLCRSVYDPRRDDADFRRSLVGTVQEQRQAFRPAAQALSGASRDRWLEGAHQGGVGGAVTDRHCSGRRTPITYNCRSELAREKPEGAALNQKRCVIVDARASSLLQGGIKNPATGAGFERAWALQPRGAGLTSRCSSSLQACWIMSSVIGTSRPIGVNE